jgi:ribonuclease III
LSRLQDENMGIEAILSLADMGDAGRTLITEALSHPSYANESSRNSYQRLEFLGDAVIGLVIAEHLYKKNPAMQEGDLTRLRAAIVRQESLAEAARRMGLPDHVLVGRGAAGSGDALRPSVMASTFEALIGAVYVLKGFRAAKSFTVAALAREIAGNVPVAPLDPKTRLQEELQRSGPVKVRYAVMSEEGPDHDKVFHVAVTVNDLMIASGTGKRKKDAEQDAAEKAYLVVKKSESKKHKKDAKGTSE